MYSPFMVKLLPSKVPANGVDAFPIGTKPAPLFQLDVALQSISLAR
ncbi:MAG: hypothetical protein AB7U85_05515 [Alphaproteobacteria bacterium]